MNAVGILHELVLAHAAVIRILEVVGIGQFKQFLNIVRSQEQPLVVQELEGVPFKRVVACGNDDARIGLQFSREDFDRRRRRKADLYNVYARQTTDARDKLTNSVARRSTVATNHDSLGLGNLQKGTHMALQDLGGKGITHDSADTRNRTHQFRHKNLRFTKNTKKLCIIIARRHEKLS